jgi:hypothetical protein
MPQINRDPIALAGADRAPKSFDVLPTLNGFDHIASRSDVQARRAAWVARRFALTSAQAQTIADLAFEDVRS